VVLSRAVAAPSRTAVAPSRGARREWICSPAAFLSCLRWEWARRGARFGPCGPIARAAAARPARAARALFERRRAFDSRATPGPRGPGGAAPFVQYARNRAAAWRARHRLARSLRGSPSRHNACDPACLPALPRARARLCACDNGHAGGGAPEGAPRWPVAAAQPWCGHAAARPDIFFPLRRAPWPLCAATVALCNARRWWRHCLALPASMRHWGALRVAAGASQSTRRPPDQKRSTVPGSLVCPLDFNHAFIHIPGVNQKRCRSTQLRDRSPAACGQHRHLECTIESHHRYMSPQAPLQPPTEPSTAAGVGAAPPPTHPPAALVLFARLPVPGQAKTRLATGVGPEAAAEFYRACAEHTFQEALRCEGPGAGRRAAARAQGAAARGRRGVRRGLHRMRMGPCMPVALRCMRSHRRARARRLGRARRKPTVEVLVARRHCLWRAQPRRIQPPSPPPSPGP
jgi:hypothetical protein